MTITFPSKLTIENVSKQLVSVRHEGEVSFVQTPLVYPSGAHVVVRVEGGPHRFFVSDGACGFDEAVLIGATLIYARTAKVIAENAGIGFDHRSLFVAEATKDQLAGAAIAVANCSLAAVSQTALRHAEKRRLNDIEELYDRMVRVFTPKKVERGAHILGASNTPWDIDVLVKTDSATIACETVTAHRQSVYAAVAKFSDIKQIRRAPVRVVFVRKKTDFGTLLPLLADNANVLEMSVPNANLLRLGEAA